MVNRSITRKGTFILQYRIYDKSIKFHQNDSEHNHDKEISHYFILTTKQDVKLNKKNRATRIFYEIF